MAFRLGIVGLGKISQDQHLPVVARSDEFQIAAVVSSRRGYDDVPTFKTPGELFASGVGLDAVSLCMPPGPRYAIAREALDAGLHVLIEKPPTPTLGELDALRRRAEERGRVLFTTWHSQYNAAVDEARRRLSGRTIARLHVSWKEDVRQWHPGQEWIWQPGGFGVFDPGINALSIVSKILPEPILVESCVLEIPSNRATPIAARARFRPSWPGDADLSAEFDWRQTGEQSWNITIATADGQTFDLKKGGAELFVDGSLAVAEPVAEYEGIYRHFAELLRSGRSHVDAAPLRLISDCFLVASRTSTERFD